MPGSEVKYCVYLVRCSPPIGEMQDETVFFEALQKISCWYVTIHNDRDEKFYLFIPAGADTKTLAIILDEALKQKVMPEILAEGTAVTTRFGEGSSGMKTVISINGESFEFNHKYYRLSKTETEQFRKI